MQFDSHNRYRRSIRLKGYDYSQPGAYFITICTHERISLFGETKNGFMELNELGEVIRTEWLKTATIRPNFTLDEWIIMPNHLHGIIVINNGRGTLPRAPGTQQRAPTERFGKPVSNSIPTIIRSFKSSSTKRINEERNLPFAPVWQRNYYEHVIRNENSLCRIREYIINNPSRWQYDSENPTGKPDNSEREFRKLLGIRQ